MAAFAAFCSLGVWQVQRRAWKLALIERVEARVHAPPVAAPDPAAWPAITAIRDEYRHVRVTGCFEGPSTFVQATTRLGAGFWALTPFRTGGHYLVLVNRGFVTPERRDEGERANGERCDETTVTGLLRMTEPLGAFLRSNDPAAGRWYSRDVAAIAAARGLGPVAPYFIDADAGGGDGAPIGGLTVIAFPNNHAVYAVTWFVLALLVAGGSVYAAMSAARQPALRPASGSSAEA